jgi:hypothetical protein
MWHPFVLSSVLTQAIKPMQSVLDNLKLSWFVRTSENRVEIVAMTGVCWARFILDLANIGYLLYSLLYDPTHPTSMRRYIQAQRLDVLIVGE